MYLVTTALLHLELAVYYILIFHLKLAVYFNFPLRACCILDFNIYLLDFNF
jgi:hypothetical protein